MIGNYISALIFVFAIAINIVIAAFVYANKPKSATHRLFIILSILISAWLIAMYATAIPALSGTYLLWARLTLVLATWMNVVFYLFAKTVPDDTLGIRRASLLGLGAAALAVTALAVSPLAFSGVSMASGRPQTIPGPGMGVFGMFVSVLNVAVIVTLFLKAKRAIGYGRKQLDIMLIGTLLMFGFINGTILVPVLVFADPTLVPYSPVYVLFLTGATAYAIFRRGLFDVRVVASEIFSAVLLFINANLLVTSESFSDFVLRLMAFIIVGVFSVLLIRSVRQEVLRREEIQLLADKLEITNNQLRRADDMKTTMVAIASHQIRGPLGGIRGYLTLFRDGDLGPLSDKQKEIMALNINVLSRLINAVETFLDITKIEAGKMALRREKIALQEVVEGVMAEFFIPMKKKGLVLNYKVEGGPFMVDIDPEKTKHIIFNLLDNAMKYTAAGSVSVRIRKEGDNAIFETTDTGMGVSAAEIPRLFGKFERGELVVDRGGSGLGLYVVKMLAEMQGGRVWVSSPGQGKGTTFSVALPLVK